MEAEKLVVRLAKAAEEKKALDIVILRVGEIIGITDYFLICSAKLPRQVKAIYQNIEKRLKEINLKPIGVEGRTDCTWVLMDYGEAVVHVFTNEKRDYYRLEKLWGDAARLNWHDI